MGDLTDPRLMWLKAGLFALGVVGASAGLLVETPHWRTAALLAIALVCAARLYYFCFYVIERYIDPTYRFAGLWSVVVYLWRRRAAAAGSRTDVPKG